jgi:hypothetical protein
MTKANDRHSHLPASGPKIAMDGAGFIAPLSEGYRRKGGQNVGPSANNPRPPPPPPFRPAQSAPLAPAAAKTK